MKYVKHFDILGVDTAQVPCIELQGVPNAATVGAVGLLGMDMTSEGHEIYKCVAVNGSVYTWECLAKGKDGVCVAKANIVGDDLILTLSDGKEINAGKVKGERGDGADGKDGVSVKKVEINADGYLITTMSDGTVINAGKAQGTDGVSVSGVEINDNGGLVLILSNGTSITAGRVVPTLQDLLGKESIGNDRIHMYYDGTKFVTAPVPFDDTTNWDKIAAASAEIAAGADPATLGLEVGMEKTITLSTGEEVTFVILGFNHDDLGDGSGKAGITFGMKDLLSTQYEILTGASQIYPEWEIRNTLVTIYDTFPSDIRKVIKEVRKTSLRYNADEGVSNSRDKLFLFSASEISGMFGGDGKQYSYYSTGQGEILKYLSNGYGQDSKWALRSRYQAPGKTTFVMEGCDISSLNFDNTDGIDETGLTGNSGSRNSGVCFGFCV